MSKSISATQAAASRINGRKSRGPKSAAGKARSRMNAWKHGLRARVVVFPGRTDREREAELEALRRQFREHLEPVGTVESILVERIVTAYWRLHWELMAECGEIAPRMGATGQGIGKFDVTASSTTAEGRWDVAILPSMEGPRKVLRYEATLERQLYRAMDQLARRQWARLGGMIPPPLMMEVSGG
jgi:hypothetical protein